MRKIALFILAAASLAAQTAFRVDPIPVMTTNGSTPAGAYAPLFAIPGATVKLYTDAGGTVPATTYTDPTACTSCPTSAPVVLGSASLCVSTTDALGNFGFWLQPGQYWYTITLVNGTLYGPFPITTSTANSGTYKAPYTASVTRPVSSKLAEIISLFDFGAKGDGMADDTAAVQAAINAIPASGGDLYVPPGIFNVTALVIAKPVHLYGTSKGGYANNAQTAWVSASTIACMSLTADCITVTPVANNIQGGFTIDNVHIVGNLNVGGSTTGSCLVLAGSGTNVIRNWTLRDVWIRQCKEYAIRLQGNTFEGTIINSFIAQSGKSGIITEVVGGQSPSHINSYGNNIELNGNYGIEMVGFGVGWQDFGSYIAANMKHGWYLAGDVTLNGTTAEGNGLSSPGNYSSYYVWVGNTTFNNVEADGSHISKYNIDFAGGNGSHVYGGQFFAPYSGQYIHIANTVSSITITPPGIIDIIGRYMNAGGCVRSTGTVTCTPITAPTDFVTGQLIDIVMDDYSYNGEWTLSNVTPTTFSYVSAGADGSTGNGYALRAYVFDENVGANFRYDRINAIQGNLSSTLVRPAAQGFINLGFPQKICWRDSLNTTDFCQSVQTNGTLAWSGGGFSANGYVYAAPGYGLGWSDAAITRGGPNTLALSGGNFTLGILDATIKLIVGSSSILSGAGAPVSVCSAGYLYLRIDGGAGTSLYVCEAGVWVGK